MNRITTTIYGTWRSYLAATPLVSPRFQKFQWLFFRVFVSPHDNSHDKQSSIDTSRIYCVWTHSICDNRTGLAEQVVVIIPVEALISNSSML